MYKRLAGTGYKCKPDSRAESNTQITKADISNIIVTDNVSGVGKVTWGVRTCAVVLIDFPHFDSSPHVLRLRSRTNKKVNKNGSRFLSDL